tara:strand:+ start:434 stop:616 length:183 start_codon:yes stop_codon:yes gene_type:complete
MLEKIKAFFRSKTIVEQGTAWYCDECKLVFMTKQAGAQHSCEYRFQDSIMKFKKDAETKI